MFNGRNFPHSRWTPWPALEVPVITARRGLPPPAVTTCLTNKRGRTTGIVRPMGNFTSIEGSPSKEECELLGGVQERKHEGIKNELRRGAANRHTETRPDIPEETACTASAELKQAARRGQGENRHP